MLQGGLGAGGVTSPQGGNVEADKYDPAKPYNQQVLNDAAIMAKLRNTLSTAQLKAGDYNGIFIVGGKGAMFDLPKDKINSMNYTKKSQC